MGRVEEDESLCARNHYRKSRYDWSSGPQSGGDDGGVTYHEWIYLYGPWTVGDSPIMGAGLYLDEEVGCATCTGLGETVLRTLAPFLAVERMRMGDTPLQVREAAIARIVHKHPTIVSYQIGILSLD